MMIIIKMKKTFVTLIQSLLAVLTFALPLLPWDELRAETPPVVPVFLDQAQPGIFPESWLNPRIAARAEPLEAKDQARARKLCELALAKYPAAVLKANLSKVYCLGRLEYCGVPTGGTNSRKVVYVVSKGAYSARDIESIFHAEFSSILLRNHARHFDEAQWQAINPPDFTYLGSGGVNAIKQKKASLTLNGVLHEQGFLNQYAQADLEDDFNSIASRLFVGDSTFWYAVEAYPKLRAKAALVMAFYGRLDASLTRERFMTFRKPEGRRVP